MRIMTVMMFGLIAAIAMCGVPQPGLAESTSGKETQEERKNKKQKKEKQEKKEKISEGKTKSSSNPVDEVNKVFDGFKKSSGSAKDDAGKARKSVNDAYGKSR